MPSTKEFEKCMEQVAEILGVVHGLQSQLHNLAWGVKDCQEKLRLLVRWQKDKKGEGQGL